MVAKAAKERVTFRATTAMEMVTSPETVQNPAREKAKAKEEREKEREKEEAQGIYPHVAGAGAAVAVIGVVPVVATAVVLDPLFVVPALPWGDGERGRGAGVPQGTSEPVPMGETNPQTLPGKAWGRTRPVLVGLRTVVIMTLRSQQRLWLRIHPWLLLRTSLRSHREVTTSAMKKPQSKPKRQRVEGTKPTIHLQRSFMEIPSREGKKAATEATGEGIVIVPLWDVAGDGPLLEGEGQGVLADTKETAEVSE